MKLSLWLSFISSYLFINAFAIEANEKKHYAILVQGSPDKALKNDITKLYETLIKKGYSPENIRVLTPDGNKLETKVGKIDTSKANSENLEKELISVSRALNNSSIVNKKTFMLAWSTHGSEDWQLQLDEQLISSEVLSDWLNQYIPKEVSSALVIDACYSGGLKSQCGSAVDLFVTAAPANKMSWAFESSFQLPFFRPYRIFFEDFINGLERSQAQNIEENWIAAAAYAKSKSGRKRTYPGFYSLLSEIIKTPTAVVEYQPIEMIECYTSEQSSDEISQLEVINHKLIKKLFVPGDVDLDGDVDREDFNLAMNIHWKYAKASDSQLIVMDLNQDGIVDSIDLSLLAPLVARKNMNFPQIVKVHPEIKLNRASEETYPTSDALLKAYKDEHQTFSKKEIKKKWDLAYLKYLEDLVIETKSNLEQ